MSMQKECCVCQKEYIDTTKRKVGKTCSKECAKKLSVAKRKENGTYTQTEEQKAKISESLKAAYASGKHSVTIEAALKAINESSDKQEILRRRVKTYQERYGSGDGKAAVLEKSRKTSLEKIGVEHWSQSKEGKEKISSIHSGKYVSPERIRALSQAAMKSQSIHSRSKKGFREDLDSFFRSTWEANYARYLNHVGIKWKYESITYNLTENKTYTPDFILDDGTIVEVKGWLTKQGKEKLDLFRKEYPDAKIVVVDRKAYNELKKLYQFKLEKWET